MAKLSKKECRICKEVRSIDRFSWRNDSKTYRTECKDCLNKSRKKQPRYGQWHKENRQYLKKYQKNYDLQRHYGIGIDDYNKMLKDQDYKCLICETTTPNNHGKFCVDHCHDTGKVRGLLCDKCNRGLGYFNDSFEFLKKAAKYLEKHKK